MNSSFFRILRSIASLRLTVGLLLLLAVQVIIGTLWQAQAGLYSAQQMVFNSWGFLAWGWFPFPGLLVTGSALLVNQLLALAMGRISFRRKTGLFLLHCGLICFMLAGFYSASFSRESFMNLAEGEASSFSFNERSWELAFWRDKDENRLILTLDEDVLIRGREIELDPLGISIRVRDYQRHAMPVPGTADSRPELIPMKLDDGTQAMPGIVFDLKAGPEEGETVLLHASTSRPLAFSTNRGLLVAHWRHKVQVLPFRLQLLEFKKVLYPNSDIPRSFSSHVALTVNGRREEKVISMNRPLRLRGFSVYQTGYRRTADDRMVSSLTLVENRGRFLPYLGGLLLVLGLSWHYLRDSGRIKHEA